MKPLLLFALLSTPAFACDATVYTSVAAHESVVRSTCIMIGTAVTVIMPAAEAAGRVDHIAGAGKMVKRKHRKHRRHRK